MFLFRGGSLNLACRKALQNRNLFTKFFGRWDAVYGR